MDQAIALLRRKLTEIRDAAVEFISEAEKYAEPKTPKTEHPSFQHVIMDVWAFLPEDQQRRGDELRGELRRIMAEIGAVAQTSVLLDSADTRMLSQNAKRMAASLRFRLFTSWGIQIHHDEGSYIGMDPPGQSEDDNISPAQARIEFNEAYRKTLETLDYMSAPRSSAQQEIHRTPLPNEHGTLSIRPGTPFIMMWINPNQPELNDVRDVVKETFAAFGIKAVRADEIEHSDGITDRIIAEIRQSEYLFADLTGERPSVYYEIGYAHAMSKPVMLYRRKGVAIHFDLAYRNCPEYENLGDLRNKLRARLTSLTNRQL
jgi:hypothetical protein